MQVRRVSIKRYRGIEKLEWCPGPGLNFLVGPGDVGKSTVLEAISTVLSPVPSRVASEYDYFDGQVGKGFRIDLVVGNLDDEVLRSWSPAPLWSWFPEKKKVQPDPDPDGEEVLCLRAEGTQDLEIEHQVIDPSEGVAGLSPSKRQRFGLSTMGAAGMAYRELRMSRGSLLTRNIEPEPLRGLVAESVKATRDDFDLPADVKDRLGELSEALESVAPGTGPLSLAMLSPRGQNLLGMIGLFALSQGKAVPLTSHGLGTQQLALFTLAHLLITAAPIFVIDEIESGLEPFRQRDLIARIRRAIARGGQAFVTTHSPAAVGEMAITEIKRMDRSGRAKPTVIDLPAGLDRVRRREPEALLSRLPVILEGQTELGVLAPLLEEQAEERGTTLGALGLHLVDGEGQPQLFKITDALRSTGQRFAAFLDNEEEHGGKRKQLAEADKVVFGTYTDARCVEEALSKQLSLKDLDQLIATPGTDGRDRGPRRYQQLNERLGKPGRTTLLELEAEHGEAACRELFSEVANDNEWFKTRATSRAVGMFLRDNTPDIQMVRDVAAFSEAMTGLIADEIPS